MIKLFEEYSRDRLGDIEDVFQSFIDDYNLNILSYECEESIIHLKEPIEYSISKNDIRSTDIIYRYKPNKDTEWQKAEGYMLMDSIGYDIGYDTTNKSIEGKIEYIKKTNYYCIDLKGSGDQISENWGDIYQGIRKCIIQLNSLNELSIYNCGCLFFKNGVETNPRFIENPKFIEINWMDKKAPYINFYTNARISICLE